LDTIASVCEDLNFSKENLGARRLHEIFEILLEDPLFDGKHSEEQPKLYTINKEYVLEKLKEIMKPLDLKRFLL
jgi:ATP-dependent HslUV protease ATP-binding subunit HslU